MSTYKVMLVDDHTMFRDGVRKIIEQIEDVQISGEAGDGLELLQLLKDSSPDLVILDLSMPNMGGLEAIKEIKRICPKTKILVLTMYKEKAFIRQVLKDGAHGFLSKDDASSELIRAIRSIKQGHRYFSPVLSNIIPILFMEDEEKEVLTMREREILKLLAEGKKTSEIAEVLFISPHTVRRHRENIMEKLHAKTLAALIKQAISGNYIAENF
jgi:DNA-binding NarL/FixJ family response regulator